MVKFARQSFGKRPSSELTKMKDGPQKSAADGPMKTFFVYKYAG
jgi:hypothetical protein